MKITSWRQPPICLLGYDIRRFEMRGGDAIYVPRYEKRFLWGLIRYVDRGRPYGPTHLQYYSPFGFLLTWPICLHVWYQFKGQDKYIDDNGIEMTKPGTEKVFYWRCGARWDAKDGFYETPSWYGPGLHWD